MFTQNHYVFLHTQLERHQLRRTEWEEVERYDGPVLPDEGNAVGGFLDRLARGLEAVENVADVFRSRKGRSILGRDSYKTAS